MRAHRLGADSKPGTNDPGSSVTEGVGVQQYQNDPTNDALDPGAVGQDWKPAVEPSFQTTTVDHNFVPYRGGAQHGLPLTQVDVDDPQIPGTYSALHLANAPDVDKLTAPPKPHIILVRDDISDSFGTRVLSVISIASGGYGFAVAAGYEEKRKIVTLSVPALLSDGVTVPNGVVWGASQDDVQGPPNTMSVLNQGDSVSLSCKAEIYIGCIGTNASGYCMVVDEVWES